MSPAQPDVDVSTTLDAGSEHWPELEDLVPPDLPPEIAVARLVALARSLLIENRQLRELAQRSSLENGQVAGGSAASLDRGAAA